MTSKLLRITDLYRQRGTSKGTLVLIVLGKNIKNTENNVPFACARFKLK